MPTIGVGSLGLHKRRIELIGCFNASIHQNHPCITERVVMQNQDEPTGIVQRSTSMSDMTAVKRRYIQVTIWDILGETPVELRKPIDPLIVSSAIKHNDKKIHKNCAKIQKF